MSTPTQINRRGRPVDLEARAARRLQILEAARRCFLRKGFHAASTADISGEAEISVAGLYQYFPSKDDLILALVEQDLAFNLVMINQLLEGDDFMIAAESLLASIERDPKVEDYARLKLEILAEASRSPTVADHVSRSEHRMQAGIARAIAQGQSRGQIDPAVDADQLALAVSCLCDGIYGRLCLPPHARGPFVEAAMILLRRAGAIAPS